MEALTVEQVREKAEEARRRYNDGRPAEMDLVPADIRPALVRMQRFAVPTPPPPTEAEIKQRNEERERNRREVWLSFPPDVPGRYRAARWATWQRKGKSVEAARKVVERWIADVADDRPSMVALIGPQGTSKSHLLACATWEILEVHEIRPDFHEWYVTVEQLRDLDTAKATRNALRKSKILVLDEARPTSSTDFDAMELAKIAMHAYAHEQSVLLATNWSSLSDLMGGPAADRFTVVAIAGPSAR